MTTSSTCRPGPRTTTAVWTSCTPPESVSQHRVRVAHVAGFPISRPPATTTVSAARTIRSFESWRATSSAFARATRRAYARGGSPGAGVSSTSAGTTSNSKPAAASKSARRGEADAKTNDTGSNDSVLAAGSRCRRAYTTSCLTGGPTGGRDVVEDGANPRGLQRPRPSHRRERRVRRERTVWLRVLGALCGERLLDGSLSVVMLPIQQLSAGVLADVIRRQPSSPARTALAWQLAVGPALARATTVALCDGVLTVQSSGRALDARDHSRARYRPQAPPAFPGA